MDDSTDWGPDIKEHLKKVEYCLSSEEEGGEILTENSVRTTGSFNEIGWLLQ